MSGCAVVRVAHPLRHLVRVGVYGGACRSPTKASGACRGCGGACRSPTNASGACRGCGGACRSPTEASGACRGVRWCVSLTH